MGYKRARTDAGEGMSSRPGAINVQTANFTRCNVKKRRRISRRKFLDRVTSASVNTYVLRCNGVNGYANPGGGWFRLANCAQGGAGAPDSGHFLPIWYFDTGAAINWTSPAGGSAALTFAQVAYRPFFRDAANSVAPQTVTFRKQITQFQNSAGAASGGNTNQLVFTGQTFSSTQNGFLKGSFQKWMSAKLLCYGIYDTPVRFRVSLIRFHKPFLTPGYEDIGFEANQGNAGTDANASLNMSVQQYLAGPFRFSPLNDQQGEMKKHFTERVLKDFVIGGVPKPATGAIAPYMHQLNIFEQFNKVCRYDWNTSIADVGDTQFNAEAYRPQANKYQPNVDFTKRWYLVIRAQSLVGSQTTDIDPVPDTTKWPSFDILMKTKYSDII